MKWFKVVFYHKGNFVADGYVEAKTKKAAYCLASEKAKFTYDAAKIEAL